MLAIIMFLVSIIGCVESQTELILPPLPYAYNALEPVLSERALRLHHDKHLQTYTDQTNIALRAMFFNAENNSKLQEIAQQPIEIILTKLVDIPAEYQTIIRNFGGGYLNHRLFFSMLNSPTNTTDENKPGSPLLEAIENSFGSFDEFKEYFTIAANSYFGSGWIWVHIDAKTKYIVLNFTINQDNPIMYDKSHFILLCIDLWEHGSYKYSNEIQPYREIFFRLAYYPDYENRRSEYIENFWRIINWSFVNQLFSEYLAR